MRTTLSAVMAIGLLAGLSIPVQAQSGKSDQSSTGAATGASRQDTGKAGDLKIGHVDYGPVIDRLFSATRELREASLLILDKNPGSERQKAFQAAQEATRLAQRAMTELPPESQVKDVTVREAKEWPVVMSRLSEARQDFEAIANTLNQRPAGAQRDQALETVKEAIAQVGQAMAAVPAR